MSRPSPTFTPTSAPTSAPPPASSSSHPSSQPPLHPSSSHPPPPPSHNQHNPLPSAPSAAASTLPHLPSPFPPPHIHHPLPSDQIPSRPMASTVGASYPPRVARASQHHPDYSLLESLAPHHNSNQNTSFDPKYVPSSEHPTDPTVDLNPLYPPPPPPPPQAFSLHPPPPAPYLYATHPPSNATPPATSASTQPWSVPSPTQPPFIAPYPYRRRNSTTSTDTRRGKERVQRRCPNCGNMNHIRKNNCSVCDAPKLPAKKRSKRIRKRSSAATHLLSDPSIFDSRLIVPPMQPHHHTHQQPLSIPHHPQQQTTQLQHQPPRQIALARSSHLPHHIPQPSHYSPHTNPQHGIHQQNVQQQHHSIHPQSLQQHTMQQHGLHTQSLHHHALTPPTLSQHTLPPQHSQSPLLHHLPAHSSAPPTSSTQPFDAATHDSQQYHSSDNIP